jgi:uncharacterized protein DUF6894
LSRFTNTCGCRNAAFRSALDLSVPRYFFDLYNDFDATDEEGKEFADLTGAKANTLKEVREMLKTSIDETGRIDLRHHVDVRDESGAVVYVMHFEDAVTVQRGEEILSRACRAV